MSRLLLVRPEAERDLFAARDWYESRRRGLGDEFLDEVVLALLELEQTPELQRLYYRDFRRHRLRRFPNKVFYQVHGERVVIFRVLHARQAHEGGLKEG
jgi:plasmid stabilization system protein ParE